MLKKILIIICIFIFTAFQGANAAAVFENNTKISKDVHIQAYPLKTISTASLDEGDFVYFVNPADLWAYEVNVIPKNSYFRGYIETLRMPVKGVNAAMVIRITDVIFPDGSVKEMHATVVSKDGREQLGGTLTPPASYNKTIHPRRGMYWRWAGTLQYVPSGDYEMGLHLTLPTNETVIIRLDEDYDSAAPNITRQRGH